MDEWLIQNKASVTEAEELAKHLSLSKQDQETLHNLSDQFLMKIPPYYLNLINPDDPRDPIKRMCIPCKSEFNVQKGEMVDPIGDTNKELNNQPVPGITHRYPDRVLLLPTPLCGGYCRFCFRKRLAGNKEFTLSQNELDEALNYIEEHEGIHEVILTGGDPLMLSDKKLFTILSRLRKMEHIWTIRLHSRMLVWNPYRITEELVAELRKCQPLWIVTHFNHPRELTELACEKISLLVDNGITVLNQAVLLRGVNDTTSTMRELFWKLIRNRVKPYYLHQLDKAQGISHFRVNIRRGIRLLRDLRGTIPGYAIPHYILDIPGGYGKVPLQYHYLNEDENSHLVVEAPDGDLQVYVDGVATAPDSLDEVEDVHPLEFYPDEILKKFSELGTEEDAEIEELLEVGNASN